MTGGRGEEEEEEEEEEGEEEEEEEGVASLGEAAGQRPRCCTLRL